jgi:His/Glu/Gln/Arg/opine family amino acid ABC transporter permease subunit
MAIGRYKRSDKTNTQHCIYPCNLPLLFAASKSLHASEDKMPFSETLIAALTLQERFTRNFLEAERWKLLLNGLMVTLQVSFFAILIGIALGVLLALLRISRKKFLSAVAGMYIDVIRGTPVVVQLMIFYFVLLGPIKWIDKTLIAAIAFGFNSGAYVAEIVRGGILSVDQGQSEAGRSLGLTRTMTMRHIILPQAFKNILPSLGNELIVLIKETSILGYIGVTDLARVGDQIRTRTLDAFMPLIAVAMVSSGLTKTLSLLLARLERRLRESDQR